MFCGKRRRDVLQERCLMSDKNDLKFKYSSSSEPGQPGQEKKRCFGVSSLPDVSQEVMHVNGQSVPDMDVIKMEIVQDTQRNSSINMPYSSSIPQPCLVPVSPRRCLRCAAGEPGHINHILG